MTNKGKALLKDFDNKDKKIFTTAVVLFALMMSLTLSDEWLGFIQRSDLDGLEKIGSVVEAKNDVRRRYSIAFDWGNLQYENEVYQGDSVFTGDKSTAKILIDNGSELDISPNSLIVLNYNSKGLMIDLEFGSIKSSLKDDTSLFITTNDQQAEIKGKDAKLQIDAGSGNSLVFSGIDGDVTILDSNSERKLGKYDIIELKKEEGLADKELTHLTLLSPLNEKRIRYVPDQPVEFKWDSNKELKRAFFKVATDKDFKNTIVRQPTSSFSYVGFSLPEDQKLYWTIVAEGVNAEVGEFWLLDTKAPKLVLPEQGQHFYYDPDVKEQKSVKVNMAWVEGSPSRRYEVQVSPSNKFTNSVQSFITDKKSFTTPLLSRGSYYWRVRGLEFVDSKWSSAGQFQIGPDPSKNLAPPALPSFNNYILLTKAHSDSQSEFEKKSFKSSIEYIDNPVAFNWRPVKNASKYKLEVSLFSNMKRKIINRQIADSQFQWNFIKPGTYYWQTTAIGDKGQLSQSSPVQKMSVEVAPPRSRTVSFIEEVVQDKALSSVMDVRPIDFEWEPVVFAKTYEFQISMLTNFDQAKTFTTTSNKKTIKLPQPDKYYWRVRALDKNNVAISKFSAPNVFEFKRVYENPILNEKLLAISPKENASFLFVGQGSSEIIFQWTRPLKKANYELEVASDRDFKELTYSAMTERSLFALKEAIPEGKYFWRVRAHKDGGKTTWTNPSSLNVKYEKNPFNSEVFETIYLAKQKAKERQKRLLAEYNKKIRALRNIASTKMLQLDTPELSVTSLFHRLEANLNPKISSLELASKRTDEFIPYIKNPPILEWSPVIAARRYFIEIAADKDFQNIIEKRPANEPYYKWDNARPGQYYFRVQAFNEKYTRSDYSRPVKMHIEVESPVSLSASRVTELMSLPRTMWPVPSEFTLTWTPRLFANKYEFEFSEKEDFLYSKTYRLNKAEKKVRVSKTGKYFWRVRPLNTWNVAISPWSEIYSVDVRQIMQAPKGLGPEGLFPLSRTIIQVGKGILELAFHLREKLDEPHVLELSNTASFNSIIKSQEVFGRTSAVKFDADVNEGTLYWRVRNPSRLRSPASQSPVYQFNYQKELEGYLKDK